MSGFAPSSIGAAEKTCKKLAYQKDGAFIGTSLYHARWMDRESLKRGLVLATPAIVLLAGLVFAGYLGTTIFLQEKRRVDDLFLRNAQNHLSALDQGFHANFETVNVLADLFRANDSVDRTQFRVFAQSLRGFAIRRSRRWNGCPE